MEVLDGLPVLLCADSSSWEEWLATHYSQPTGIWLKIAKKASGQQSVSYAEAVDGALCYGWIDGLVRSYDDKYYLQRFTPRRPKSIWSKINVEKVAQLTKNGRMKPAGLAAVEAAKQDGRWEQAYESSSTMTVPADFQAKLDQNPDAQAFFSALNKTDKYSFLWRIETAGRSKTRVARIDSCIAMLAAGEKFHN